MLNFIIVSEDYCFRSQLVNVIQSLELDNPFKIEILTKSTFNFNTQPESIYIIDLIYSRVESIQLVEHIFKSNSENKLALFCLDKPLQTQLKSLFPEIFFLSKTEALEQEILNFLDHCQTNTIQIMMPKVDLQVNTNQICYVQKYGKDSMTLHYQSNQNDIHLHLLKTPLKIKEKIIFNQITLPPKKKKKANFTDEEKQKAVDLYQIYGLDPEIIGKMKNIDPRNIKNWAKQHRFLRKPSLRERMFRNWIQKKELFQTK